MQVVVRTLCWLGVVAALARAQTSDLEKIKAAVMESLRRLPNYTCTETFQRTELPIISGRPRLMMAETVRLDVAYLDGKEMFGWPASGKIDEADITKLISGSVGNGYFGLFPNSIFSAANNWFQLVGAVDLDGKKSVRYDYRVPKANRAYELSNGSLAAVVGFHGSFWVDPATLDLMRITVIADDPPAVLDFASATGTLDFERKLIGGSSFVIPKSAEMIVVSTNGTKHQSSLSFAACHQFVGEAVLKFDDPSVEPAAPTKIPIREVTLPDDFTVLFTLETPIDWSTAGGDPVRATLRESVQVNRVVVVPKGARLTGRIAHVVMRGDLYYVELAFTSLDFEGGHADLSGRRSGVSKNDAPLIFRNAKFKLAKGDRFTLHSRLLKSVHNDSIRP